MSTQLDVVIFRPPLVYRAGVKANFLALVRAIARGWRLPFASIQNGRSFLYVGNLASAIVACLDASQAANRCYVLSDGRALSTPELCARLGEALLRSARLFRFPPAWRNETAYRPRSKSMTPQSATTWGGAAFHGRAGLARHGRLVP